MRVNVNERMRRAREERSDCKREGEGERETRRRNGGRGK